MERSINGNTWTVHFYLHSDVSRSICISSQMRFKPKYFHFIPHQPARILLSATEKHIKKVSSHNHILRVKFCSLLFNNNKKSTWQFRHTRTLCFYLCFPLLRRCTVIVNWCDQNVWVFVVCKCMMFSFFLWLFLFSIFNYFHSHFFSLSLPLLVLLFTFSIDCLTSPFSLSLSLSAVCIYTRTNFNSYILYNIVTFIWLRSYLNWRKIFFVWRTHTNASMISNIEILLASKLDIFCFTRISEKNCVFLAIYSLKKFQLPGNWGNFDTDAL